MVQPATVSEALQYEESESYLPDLAQQLLLVVRDEGHQSEVVRREVWRLTGRASSSHGSGEISPIPPEELLCLLSEEPQYEE